MFSTTISKAIAAAALCGAAFLTGCAGGPLVNAGPPRNDTLFTQIQAGMTKDDIQRLFGPPDETMPFARSHTEAWDYHYYDSWGYNATCSVIFGADGRVQGTYTGRLHGGGDFSP